jgi:hypothetical protein
MSAGRTITAVTGVLAAALILSAVVVWQASRAAFTATTANPGNEWEAGDVQLVDDDGGGASLVLGSALFAASPMVPGDPASVHCINVTYGGTVPAPVRLYADTVTGTGFDTYLDLTVEEGTGASDPACTGFTAASVVFDATHRSAVAPTVAAPAGTLADFVTHSTDYASGAGSWTPVAAAQVRSYRFTVAIRDDNAARGLTASARFLWEAQNA